MVNCRDIINTVTFHFESTHEHTIKTVRASPEWNQMKTLQFLERLNPGQKTKYVAKIHIIDFIN